MKISSFDPSLEDSQAIGLDKISFSRLGSLVVLAGPNGGGKTRILGLLERYAQPSKSRVAKRDRLIGDLARTEAALAAVNGPGHPNATYEQSWKDQIAGFKSKLNMIHAIALEDDSVGLTTVRLVPKGTKLVDPMTLTPQQLNGNADRLANWESRNEETIQADGLAYIQRLQNRYEAVTHQNYAGPSTMIVEAVDAFSSLNSLVNKLLGAPLTRSYDGEAQLLGRPLGSVDFSDGQKILLQFAAAIHPSHQDQSLVVLMDEPENHLHPAALIDVLDRVRGAVPEAQLWIATHSVPLIAHCYAEAPDCLHFVHGGKVKHAGRKPGLVLEGLLGSDAEQTKLLNLIDLPHQLAAVQFAASCLCPPAVAEHVSDDVQVTQIRSLLRGEIAAQPLKVLDLGAGKGRLLAGLSEGQLGSADLDYVAFDKFSTDRAICEAEIVSVYGSAAKRWYSDADALFADHGKASFDVIVLCNVLHEIRPDDWFDVLGPSGLAFRALTPDGHLMIVEDLRIPVGERPNARGFFLLNTIHLQELFRLSARDDSLQSIKAFDARGDDRLKTHVVPRSAVERVTSESRTLAIQALQETCFDKLKVLREGDDRTFQAGQLNALWSQQLASCQLYLRDAGRQDR